MKTMNRNTVILSAILATLIVAVISIWAVPAYREHRAQEERRQAVEELFGKPRPAAQEPAAIRMQDGTEWGNASRRHDATQRPGR